LSEAKPVNLWRDQVMGFSLLNPSYNASLLRTGTITHLEQRASN
jgi:hypothetical protein